MAERGFRGLNPLGGDVARPDDVSLDTVQRVAELRAEIRTLKAVILHLVACQVQNSPVCLHEDPMRGWLGLQEGSTPEQALERLLRTQARVLGKVRCPACGAVIPDREGIHDERCVWCGAHATTEK